MPIINPSQDAAYFPVTVISSAGATVQITRTPGAALYSGKASASIRGSLQRAARAGESVRGILTPPARASLQAGIAQRPATGGAASLQAGTPSRGDSFAGMGINGNVPSSNTRATLDVSNPGGGLSPIPRRAALAGVSIRRDASGGATALAALGARGESRGRTLSALNLRLQTLRGAVATLEAARAGTYAGRSALEVGTRRDASAKSALEVTDAGGVEFLIDVIDAILATGRGDLC